VLLVALGLGLTSFSGPIAYLGFAIAKSPPWIVVLGTAVIASLVR